MLRAEYTTQFKKDLKLAQRRHLDIERLKAVISKLCCSEKLPEGCRDHELTGSWRRHRECHIQPDWLLIYKVEQEILTLTLTRTGTHSDLLE